MVLFLNNKRGVSEITSFVLITLIIVFASSISYIFSKSLIEDSISKLDKDNLRNDLLFMKDKLNLIQNFDSSTSSYALSFNVGELNFSGNNVYYQSLEKISASSICLEDLCYQNVLGFERMYFNLSNSYTFSNSLTLPPGNYLISFKNLKATKQIKIMVKS